MFLFVTFCQFGFIFSIICIHVQSVVSIVHGSFGLNIFCVMYVNLTAITWLLLFISAGSSSIVLQDNGYTNIVVAISEDVAQPEDRGFAIIKSLKELLTETSYILLAATNYTMYLKDIKILIPSKWNVSASVITTEHSFELADIRVTSTSNDTYGSLMPHTLHSGKCGVAGNFITLPLNYVIDESDNTTVKAKATVQQWAQYRYGVFEEHGYPDDKLLPYFYRHPDGYDAITSSNDTIVKGDLLSLTGGDCQIDGNGLISNQSDCRFIPDATGQTATASLMSFHWLDSVVGFSEKDTHDKRPPHRQNRLCSSRSSSEIVFQSPDLIDNEPKPDQNPLPGFRIFQNKMLPVLYLAIDTSKPASPNNAGATGIQILRNSLKALFISIGSNHPDIYVAWSTFENTDSGQDIYLKEEIAPIRFEEGKEMFQLQIDNLTFSENVLSRDVSAVLRDAVEPRLRQYKDTGGSILYIITSTESTTKDTVMETNLAEKVLLNNIKLIVAESGPGNQALSRFSIMSEGSYYFKISWGTTAYFTPINTEIIYLCTNGIRSKRRTIMSKKDPISISDPWIGSFFIDETIGKNTTVVLQSPIQGSFTVTIDSPSGQQLILENNPEARNWNDSYSTVGVNWLPLIGIAEVGEWNYTVAYNSSMCSTCQTVANIHLQVSSSIRSTAGLDLPKFKSWISLTPGLDYVDLSQHPAIIQVRFDSKDGRLGGLTVTADLIQNSAVVKSIPLTDTGTFDSDISNDGIYSGIFYPENDGIYTVNLYALQSNGGVDVNKRMMNDQNSFCCGSSLPTVNLKYFQSTFMEAITFQVRNSSVPSQEWTNVIIDFQASTYGVDKGNVYVLLSWTVPLDTKSQIVRYSDDYNQLLNEFNQAPEATVVYGSLEVFEIGAPFEIYVSSPYTEGRNVYFVVETTGTKDRKSRSNLVWTEPYPPENPFIPPSTTPGPTVTTDETATTTEITTIEESTVTTTEESTIITTTTKEETTDVTTEQEITTINTTEEITTNNTTEEITTNNTTEEITTIITTQEDTSVTTTPQESNVTTTPQDQSTSVITTEDTSSISTTDLSDTTVKPPPPPNGSKLSSAEIGYIVGGVILFICLVAGVIVYYKKKRDGHRSVKMDLEGSEGNGEGGETILPRVPLTLTEKPIEIQLSGEQDKVTQSLTELGSDDVNNSANQSPKDDVQDTNDLIAQSSSTESNIDNPKLALPPKEVKQEIKDPISKGKQDKNILAISELYSQKLLKSESSSNLPRPKRENVSVNDIDVNTNQ